MPQTFEEFVFQGDPPAETFRPMANYDADGDCIEFFLSRDNFYGKRLDSLVTVYLRMDGDEIVGGVIKGVSKIFKEMRKRAPGFQIEIVERRIELASIITACLWRSNRDSNSVEVRIYKELRKTAMKNHVGVEGDFALA